MPNDFKSRTTYSRRIKINKSANYFNFCFTIKTQSKKYFETLASKRITALAFEFIRDEDGAYPAVRALSEIAGTASVLIASELLSNSTNGNGLMFGNISGVPPIEVVILGAGTVGEFAARSAIGLGANVKSFRQFYHQTSLRANQLRQNTLHLYYSTKIS